MQWGQAKVEVAALRDEILERVQEGKTLNHIFQEFKSNGRINASRPSFYRCARELLRPRNRPNLERGRTNSTTRHARAPEPSTPRNAPPSSSPAPEPDGPRIADAAFNRMPVSRDASYASSSTADVDPDVWDGKPLKDPEVAS